MKKLRPAIIRLTKQATGKDLSIFDEFFLSQSLEKRITKKALGIQEDYFAYLKQNSGEMESLIESLTISYSEFFRDPLVFALLEQWIFPVLFTKKKKSGHNEVRIWSAAGAAGQEAYSLAMLLDDMQIEQNYDIRVRILATDVSETQIEKAKEGQFVEEQLQKVTLKYLNQYFYKKGEKYKIISRIRDSVDFSTYDLLDMETHSPPESIFGTFDLIICSNVLIYYNTKSRKQIIGKLKANMTSDGLLVTGDVEREIILEHKMQDVCPPAPVFQKFGANGYL